jgi:branched-chain amino acid transport system substrate-binding protein
MVIGCNRLSPNAEVPEIRIGVLDTLSGESTTVGEATVKGAELAVADLQAEGGIDVKGQRRPVTLVIEDDRDQVDAVVNAVRKLIYQDNVVAIVGPQRSRNAIPAAQLAEEAQVPLISPKATNPEVTRGKSYAFRTTFIDPFQGEVMANFARQDLGAETAAILFDVASAYNRGIAEVFGDRFEAAGGQIVAYESYTTGETDFTPQLTTIREAGPDVIFLPNYQFEVPLQVQKARELGIDSTFLGSDSWGSIVPEKRPLLEGAYFSDQFSPDADTPNTQAFIQKFQETYNELPTGVSASTYDAIMLVAQAIEVAGEASPAAIRQGLSDIGQFQGVTGSIEFHDTGDPISSAVILNIQGDQFLFHKQIAKLDRHRRYVDGTIWVVEGGPYTLANLWDE